MGVRVWRKFGGDGKMAVVITGKKSNSEEIFKHLKQFYLLNQLPEDYVFFDDVNMFFLNLKKFFYNISIILNSDIDLAYRVRKTSPKTKIIFISSTDMFAVEGYKADISCYLLQPVNFEDFEFAMKKCLGCFNKKSEYIEVSSNWQKLPVFFKDILFAEKNGHNIVIHTKKETISTRMTFRDFVAKTKNFPHFINCVRGALVNLDWVSKMETQNFLMASGERIPIRRQDRKKFRQIYAQYLIERRNQG